LSRRQRVVVRRHVNQAETNTCQQRTGTGCLTAVTSWSPAPACGP